MYGKNNETYMRHIQNNYKLDKYDSVQEKNKEYAIYQISRR